MARWGSVRRCWGAPGVSIGGLAASHNRGWTTSFPGARVNYVTFGVCCTSGPSVPAPRLGNTAVAWHDRAGHREIHRRAAPARPRGLAPRPDRSGVRAAVTDEESRSAGRRAATCLTVDDHGDDNPDSASILDPDVRARGSARWSLQWFGSGRGADAAGSATGRFSVVQTSPVPGITPTWPFSRTQAATESACLILPLRARES